MGPMAHGATTQDAGTPQQRNKIRLDKGRGKLGGSGLRKPKMIKKTQQNNLFLSNVIYVSGNLLYQGIKM